jgi:uncharacterized membrane protein YkvA (DUF1232 family)
MPRSNAGYLDEVGRHPNVLGAISSLGKSLCVCEDKGIARGDVMKTVDPVQAFYNWYRSTIRNTKYRWAIIVGTLLYLLSPIDIAPDFIPIIGWIDDSIVAALLVSELSQLLLTQLNRRSDRNVASASDTASPSGSANPTTIDVEAEAATM